MFCNDKSTVFLLFVLATANLRRSFAEQSFELNRLLQDKFRNPTVNVCSQKGQEFCEKRRSQCDWNGSGGCCYCICGHDNSTFDESRMTCRTNVDVRAGCNFTFENLDSGQPIQLVDLSNAGSARIIISTEVGDKVTTCHIKKVLVLQGREFHQVKDKFLVVEEVDQNARQDWFSEIEWRGQVTFHHGKIFKVDVNCNILRRTRGAANNIPKTDCFVFKSSGMLNVSLHLLPSPTTVVVPDIVEPTFIPTTNGEITLPTHAVTVTENKKSLQGNEKISIKDQSVTTSSTPNIPETSKNVHSKSGHESDGKGDKAVVISSAIIVALLVVAAFLLLFLWTRRRSGKFSTQKQIRQGFLTRGTMACNNPIVMSNHEPIYAAVDDVVTSGHFGGNGNADCEYAVSTANSNYTCLDKSIPEYKPSYQSLTTSSENQYEHISGQRNVSSSPATRVSGQHTESESFCRIVNGPEMTTLSVPDEIYHILEEPTELGDYQVSGRVTPYGSGSTPQERVYSVLEDDSEGERLGRTPDSEYLVVLPDYEQPERSPA